MSSALTYEYGFHLRRAGGIIPYRPKGSLEQSFYRVTSFLSQRPGPCAGEPGSSNPGRVDGCPCLARPRKPSVSRLIKDVQRLA